MRRRAPFLTLLLALVAVACGGAYAYRHAHSFERFHALLEADVGAELPVGAPRPLAFAPDPSREPLDRALELVGVPLRPGYADLPDPWPWRSEDSRPALAALDVALEEQAPVLRALEEAEDVSGSRLVVPAEGRAREERLARGEALAHLLELRAFRQGLLGRGDDAARTLSVAAFLSRAVVDDAPGLEAQQLRFRAATAASHVEWLLRAEVSEDECLELGNDLAGLLHGDEATRAIEGERAVLLGRAALGWGTPDLGEELFPPQRRDKPSDVNLRGTRRPGPEVIRDYVRAATELAAAAWRRDRGETQAIAVRVLRSSGEETGLDLRVLELTQALDAQLELEARLAVARVALALRVHRIRKGAYPDSLYDLVPGTVRDLPRDPFGGRGLRYYPVSKGFRLWSVGRNGRDDGGPDAFLSYGTRSEDRDDLGVAADR